MNISRQRLLRSALRRSWPLLRWIGVSFVDELCGARFRFVAEERISELAYRHFHECEELAVARRFVTPGDLFIDVGANIGLFSCVAALSAGATGMVIAVEPNDEVLPRLSENLRINNASNVCILSAGVGAIDGMGELRCPSKFFNAFGSMADLPGSENWTRRSIPVLCLDTIWRLLLSGKPVAYLKIDVEGLEGHVIDGGTKLLHSPEPPVVQFELNQGAYKAAGFSPKEVIGKLKHFGYRVYGLALADEAGLTEVSDIPGSTESANLFAVPGNHEKRFRSVVKELRVKQ
jgi:FkbM family methyltransferase